MVKYPPKIPEIMKIYPFRGLPSLANTMKLLHTNFRHHPSIIEEMTRNAPKELGMNSLTEGEIAGMGMIQKHAVFVKLRFGNYHKIFVNC